MVKKITLAGDLIIDWIIHQGACNVYPGGVGNMVRGLQMLGYEIELTTIYNPMVYPLGHVIPLNNSLQDFDYRNISVRNYDQGVFQRFREGMKPRVFSGSFDAVVAHEETCIRDFRATYADVRDITASGDCKILRMSSSDPWEGIMAKIEHEVAIVTYSDKVKVYDRGNHELYRIDFPRVDVKDTVGAGDTFSVWLIDEYFKQGEIRQDVIVHAVRKAQEKVGRIGVFVP